MGHNISAIIGKQETVRKLADACFLAKMIELLQEYSSHTKFAYIETDYFGGVGTQGGVLYENSRVAIEPRSGAGTINLILRELGVACVPGKDEFDSLNLGKYRHMPS